MQELDILSFILGIIIASNVVMIGLLYKQRVSLRESKLENATLVKEINSLMKKSKK